MGSTSDFYIEKIEFVNVEAEDGWIQGGAIWVYNPAALNDRWSAGANTSWQSASDNRGYFLANMAEFNVNAILQVNGSWASGLRPLQAKITYQSDIESADPFAIEFEFRSSDNTILADVGFGGNNSHTNHTIDLDFTDYEEDKDIHQLRFFCHPGQEGDPQILMNIRTLQVIRGECSNRGAKRHRR